MADRDGGSGRAPALPSPRAAVREVERLRGEEDWEALGDLYDLRGSEVGPGRVASRSWYEEGARPEPHPLGGQAAGEPFPPGSSYVGHAVDGEVARVTVRLDPAVLPPDPVGPGGEPPSVLRVFFLLRGGGGWRLLAPDDTRIGP